MASPRPRRLGRAALVAVTTLAAGLGISAPSTVASAAPKVQEPGVTANLWEWNWDSIAAECPKLHSYGYNGVQVAPPQDSIKRTAADQANPNNGETNIRHPWWEVYQVVDYNLTSRMGTEDQFKAMVKACRTAKVKVYVDAVINHTTGQGSSSYGGVSFTQRTNYPDYTGDNFHQPGTGPNDCPTAGGIDDFNARQQVFKCDLVGLADLRTETPYVRNKLAAYLNKLLGYGVSGFRVDAGKHIGQTDLNAIYGKLGKTKDGVRPYWTLEVFGGSPGVLSPQAFTTSGDVLGLDGAKQIHDAFKSYTATPGGDISGLATFGAGSGLTPSNKTMSFVTNHDTDRNDGSQYLTQTDGNRYFLANEWLLADGYGSPQVFSSFNFTVNNQSPPSGEIGTPQEGLITDTVCGADWSCDHAKQPIVGMVKFHQYAAGAPKRNVYDRQVNVLAFSRGSKAWAGFNNNGSAKTVTVQTGLRRGYYCDVITGVQSAGSCTGTKVYVNGSGNSKVTLPAVGAVAFTKADRI